MNLPIATFQEVEEITPDATTRLIEMWVFERSPYTQEAYRHARKFLEFIREVTLYLGNFIVCSQHSKKRGKVPSSSSDVSSSRSLESIKSLKVLAFAQQ